MTKKEIKNTERDAGLFMQKLKRGIAYFCSSP